MLELLARDVMVKKVITINKNASVAELSELLVKNKISGVPVVDDSGKLVGIATEGDLIVRDADLHFPRYFKLLDSIIYLESLNKFKRNLRKYLGTKVEDVMTSKVKIVKEDTPVNVVANIMIRDNVNRVPVLDNDGNLVGIITRADIVKSMI
ncbi:A-adding tRNA nucleotidyltransferase [subsurface metagenome]|nr:CBS domain-containing protein [Clostridia bacterium]TET16225.1 MAG: CBS domain-containing protein [Actinomycetota bacterium]